MSGVAVTWLGQSGYAIRAPGDELLLIDPYLSESVRNELGVPRVPPIPLDPATTVATAVVGTHWHLDHLDPITCRALAAASPEALFAGPPSIRSRLRGWGVASERVLDLERGGRTRVGPFALYGVFARHEVPGWLAEDAIGVVIEVAGSRIYHSGDTEYDARILPVRELGPFDLGLFVANGTGGNMNALEAALLAHQLGPALAVPNHYGMWAPEGYGPGATLDPTLFAETCALLGGPRTQVLEHGETLELPS